MTPVSASVVELYRGNVLYALLISRAFTWSGVSSGCACNNRATAPLTTGAAMLVPFRKKYWPEIESVLPLTM